MTKDGFSRDLLHFFSSNFQISMSKPGPYSEEAKRIILGQLRDENGKINPKYGKRMELSNHPNAPSRKTIYRWIKDESCSTKEPVFKKPKGVAPKLTDTAKDILAGKVLSRLSHHKTVDQEFIHSWVLEAADIDLSNSTITRYMHELGFRSKRARENILHASEASSKTMIEWLKKVHTFITENEIPPENIVCMDQISLWDHGIKLNAYALVGG
jgi:hypothetical protein